MKATGKTAPAAPKKAGRLKIAQAIRESDASENSNAERPSVARPSPGPSRKAAASPASPGGPSADSEPLEKKAKPKVAAKKVAGSKPKAAKKVGYVRSETEVSMGADQLEQVLAGDQAVPAKKVKVTSALAGLTFDEKKITSILDKMSEDAPEADEKREESEATDAVKTAASVSSVLSKDEAKPAPAKAPAATRKQAAKSAPEAPPARARAEPSARRSHQARRSELESLSTSKLQRWARSMELPDEKIDGAIDLETAREQKAALIALIMKDSPATSTKADAAPKAAVTEAAAEVEVQQFTVDMKTPMSIVLFGATGDLAKKKLYPALYQLMFGAPDAPKIPQHANVIGYGRSDVDLSQFLEKQCVNVKGPDKEQFLKRCSFFAGAYDKQESFARLHKHLTDLEGGGPANRLYFFSVPPTVFADVARGIESKATAPDCGGWTRLILEKPFGRDSETFAELNSITAALYRESELFRIDHYLGKEVVLNLTALRFGNQFLEDIWNRNSISSVQIVFKENLGTGGRGGYFDGFGIIRDIMQNHLLQVLLWLTIEPPSALTRDAIQHEKCKLLKAIKAVAMEDCFLGQFCGNSWQEGDKVHTEPGYLDDETVPKGSKTPTYAAVVLNIENERWRGVPFMMRAGKGHDERLAEIRITFKEKSFNKLVPGQINELVMRIQPDEAIYLKCMNKMPGWEQDRTAPVVLDMSYAKSFPGNYVADAYERMFFNAAKGDGSIFVGAGELIEAWRIFTPLLKEIDDKKPDPVIYRFGVRVPPGMDAFAAKYGITMAPNFEERLAHMGHLGTIERVFAEQGRTSISIDKVRDVAKQIFDGLDPTEAQMKNIMRRLDLNNDGSIELAEVKAAAVHLAAMYSDKPNSELSSFDEDAQNRPDDVDHEATQKPGEACGVGAAGTAWSSKCGAAGMMDGWVNPALHQGGIALFIIDPQNDFHEGGSLAVTGATQDSENIANFLKKYKNQIERVVVTLDTHHDMHIHNPVFWVGPDEAHPPPLTIISLDDVQQGKWKARQPQMRQWSLEYVERLTKAGRFPMCIWPQHCILGSSGHAVHKPLMDALNEWATSRARSINWFFKGQNNHAEMYSALKAEVECDADVTTYLHADLIRVLASHNMVVCCGEAMSHCVNWSVRHLLSAWPQGRASDIVLLEDAASAVTGFEETAKKFMDDMRAAGVIVCKTADVKVPSSFAPISDIGVSHFQALNIKYYASTAGSAGLMDGVCDDTLQDGMCLLIIDPQNDFHEGGSLAVSGATEDSKRIAQLIRRCKQKIERIVVTLDTHHAMHIHNPPFWMDKDGKHPDPFTIITSEEITSKKWQPRQAEMAEWAGEYVKNLETNTEFAMCIWPMHCLLGTEGHAVHPPLMKALTEWAVERKRSINWYFKGQNNRAEMYSALKSEVAVEGDATTVIDKGFIAALAKHDKVVCCGEALSHCVNYSVRHLLSGWQKCRAADIIVLQDGASPVTGFDKTADTFLADMRKAGVTVCQSTELV